MGACNCGGKCNDCKKIAARTLAENFCDPHFTGNIKYDGTVSECEANADISLTEGRSLNAILLGFKAQLCTMATPVYQETSTNTPNAVVAGTPEALLTLTVEVAGVYTIDFGVNLSVLDTAKWNAYITLSVPSINYGVSGNNSWGENVSGSTVQQNGSNSIVGLTLAVGTIVSLFLDPTVANVTASSSMLAITKIR